MNGRIHTARLVGVLTLVISIALGPLSPALAQSGAEPWTPPANLSQSGAASAPVALPQPNGGVRVFWWDRIDGVQLVERVGEEWSSPVSTPILVTEALEQPSGQIRYQTEPIAAMPWIVGDATGRALALWLGEVDPLASDRARPLLYAVLPAGQATWSDARTLAESTSGFAVATDATGALHVAYLRDIHTSSAPSGVVYRRSVDGGQTWSTPVWIDQSLHYRLIAPENIHIRIAGTAAGQVVLTWNAPVSGQGMLAGSGDGGATWSEPATIGGGDVQAADARPFVVPNEAGEEILVLWDGVNSLGQCAVYQASASDLVEGGQVTGQRALEGLASCTGGVGESLLPIADGQTIMVAGGGADSLALSVWNGAAWSEPRQQTFSFADPSTGEVVYLSSLQGALLQATADAAESPVDVLAVVGVDQAGDVWFTQSRVGALEWAFAPPAPWSAPVGMTIDSASAELPAVAIDEQGWVHALWAEPEAATPEVKTLRYARWSEGGWTRSTTVLRPSQGSAVDPCLTITPGYLHAVWSEGPNGQVYYSRAFLRDAYAASGWEEPRPLPGPTSDLGIGSGPQIVSAPEPAGVLYAVYTVPVNEGRGVYLTASEDAGTTWSPVRQVFDAEAAGWTAVLQPKIAVGPRGDLHIVWVHAALSSSNLSLGVYYARSFDGGETWSEPYEIAGGSYVAPQVAADGLGNVHMFWNEATGSRALWHQQYTIASGEVSVDMDSARPERISAFTDVLGAPSVVGDGALGLHVVGLGRDNAGEPALLHLAWSESVEDVSGESEDVNPGDEAWSALETYRLEPVSCQDGVAVALHAGIGRLVALYRTLKPNGGGTAQQTLLYASRPVSVSQVNVGLPPLVQVEAIVTATPEATQVEPTQTANLDASPTPDLAAGPPPTSGGTEDFIAPLLLSGGLAALLIVVGVVGRRLLTRNHR
ncbi:MAG: exo-alpha-sialidase [Anaerolineales bacterium]|nr:exo-alpha-sialidase [Anaerolineales bacterium]